MDDEYGQRVPDFEDITAIAAYLEVIRNCVAADEFEKAADRAMGVFEVYCEQFQKAENG